MMSKPSVRAILAALVLALLPSTVDAQRSAEEWVAAHLRDARAQAMQPRGAIPLLRLRAFREHVDPTLLLDRVQDLAASPTLPPLRRALAAHIESEVRRDLGQIGEADAIARSLGYLQSWWVLGPFDNEGRAGFARTFAPETTPGAALDTTTPFEGKERPIRWRRMPTLTTNGFVALDAVVRPSVNACAFAATTLRVPRSEPAVLWLGATGSIAAMVNGRTVFRDAAVRRAWPDRAGVTVTLRAGLNRVLLKVCSDDRGLGFYARFTRPDGTARTDLVVVEEAPAVPVIPAPEGAPLPPVLGVFEALQRAVTDEAPPERAEDLARYLHLTGSDDFAAPRAADLAETVVRARNTAAAWLLVGDLTTDHNRRLDAVRHALALSPNDPHVLFVAAHQRRLGARAEECIALLDEAIRLDAGFVPAYIERAMYFDNLGLPLAALAEIGNAAVLAPRTPSVLHAQLQIAEHAGQTEHAQSLRRALLRVRYFDLDAHEGIARDARQRGDRDEVRRAAERIMALRPELLSTYTQVAELYEAIGEGDLAVGTLARGVAVAPDEPTLWTSRGELEERLGRRDDARISMRAALALRPQDAALRRRLEAMEQTAVRADEASAEEPAVFLARRSPPGTSHVDYHIRSLSELTVRTVYANGLSGMFRQIAYEVRDDEGAREGRVYGMQYDPLSQRFELRGAWVHHADGTRDEGTQVEEYDANSDPSTRMYFSNRVVQVTFPRLRAGDVVEARWRVDDISSRNAFADYFGDLEVVQAGVPRARWTYLLRAPASRSFFMHTEPLHDGRTLLRSERAEGDTRVLSFSIDDVPAVPPEENSPGVTERAAYLHVSTYRSWQEVGRWYWGLVRDQLIVDERVRSAVREATRGLTNPRDKVRAIYNWVISHTRYVALEFGIHGFKPYAVPQVCARGFGDCKDKASLIVTMLREAGINASIALVRTRRNGSIEASPASLAIFDHAIAYVPSLDLFLDGTAQHSGMDELPSGDQGVMALVVDRNGDARLMQTPVYTPDRNVTTVRGDVTLAADGSAVIRTSQRVFGPDAGNARSSLEAQASRVERIEDSLREHHPGVRVTAVRTGDLSDRERAAEFSYEATVPTFATRQGAMLHFAPVNPMNLARRLCARSSRTHDVVVGVPSTFDETRTIHLPANVSGLATPADVHIDAPFGRLDLSFEQRTGAIVVRRVLIMSRDRVGPQEYPAFRAFVQSVDDALARRVTMRIEEAAR